MIANETLEEIARNSFLDFHVKGFSYLCLKRTDAHTRKLYFFEGDVSQLPEVVAPHDHRYNFMTRVVTGCVENRLYRSVKEDAPSAVPYEKFEWRTPLNGGSGFSWASEAFLSVVQCNVYWEREEYSMPYAALHTIQIRRPGTILRLDQYADRVPLDQPTTTYMKDKNAPSLSGLYRKPTVDDVRMLLATYALAVAKTT